MKGIKQTLCALLAAAMMLSFVPVSATTDERIITENISQPSDTKINMFEYWTVGEQNDFDNDVQIEDMHEAVGGGINQNHLLLFGNCDGAYSGIGENDWCKSTVGEWNCYTGPTPENTVFIDGPGHPYRGIVSEELGEDGYPKLDLGKEHIIGTHDVAIPEVYFDKTARTKTNESLAYLFDPSEKNQSGKAVYENATGLFRKNDNGYYYFNSDNDNNGNNCFAELNTENGENKFVLYETPWLYNDKPQFFPFSNHTDLVNEQNGDVTGEKVNHYFGMMIEHEFMQPKDGIVKTDTLDDKDMTFEISGDDDIWVFIDNKLAIDMGGIHEKCRAEINFKTGVIDYYNDAGVKFRTVYLSYAMGERSGELDSEKWKTLKDSTNGNNFSVGTFADNTIHTMKVFYLERGNNDSDFGIKFNTVKPKYTTTWAFGKMFWGSKNLATGGATEEYVSSDTDSMRETDKKAVVDPTNGGFDNSSRTDEWCGWSNNAKISVPVVNGSIVTVKVYYPGDTFTINGVPFGPFDSTDNVVSYTYIGDAANIDVVSTQGGFISYIKVESPVKPQKFEAVESDISYECDPTDTVEFDTGNAQKGTAGQLVTFKVTAKAGHSISDVKVLDASDGTNVSAAGLTDNKDGTWSFTMPAKAVKIKVTTIGSAVVSGTISGIEEADKTLVKLYIKEGNDMTQVDVQENGSYSVELISDKTYSIFGLIGGTKAYTLDQDSIAATNAPTLDITATPVTAAPQTGTKTYDFTQPNTVVPGTEQKRFSLTNFVTSDGIISFNDPANSLSYYNTHGLNMKATTIRIAVAGNATINFIACQFAGTATMTAVTANITPAGAISMAPSSDGSKVTFNYTGDATVLEFSYTGSYLHGIEVTNN